MHTFPPTPNMQYSLSVTPNATYLGSRLTKSENGVDTELTPAQLDELAIYLKLIADSQRDYLAAQRADVGRLYHGRHSGRNVYVIVATVDRLTGEVFGHPADKDGEIANPAANPVRLYNFSHFKQIAGLPIPAAE